MNGAEPPISTTFTDALRRAATGYPFEEAAVNLLAEHGHWLRRTVFLDRVAVVVDADRVVWAQPHWSDIHDLVTTGTGLPDTDSEVGVLWVATSLARGALNSALTSCDHRNRWLICDAIVSAAGLDR